MALRISGLVIAVVAIIGFGWWFLSAESDLAADFPGLRGDDPGGWSPSIDDPEEPTGVDAVDPDSKIDTNRYEERERAALPDALTLVFEDEAHVPQAGVEVRCLLRTQFSTWMIGTVDDPLVEWATFRADTHGEVVLRQLPPSGLRVVGRGKDLLGAKSLGFDEVAPGQRIVVTMKPIRRVHVKVVDQAGQPVGGAPVGAVSYTEPSPGIHWTTLPDGVAEFEVTALHAQAHRAKTCVVQVKLPNGTTASKPVPWVDGDLTRVQVEVKRGSLVRIKVIDAEGNLSVARRTVSWEYDSGKVSGNSSRSLVVHSGFAWAGNAGRSYDAHVRRTFVGSETIIAGFDPGKKIRFKLQQEGRCAVERTVRLPSDDSLTEIVMSEGGPAPVIEIPLVHERIDGAPVASGRFSIEFNEAGASKTPNMKAMGTFMFSSSSSMSGFVPGGGRVVRAPGPEGVIRIDAQPGKALDLKVNRERAGAEMAVFFGGGRGKERPGLLETRVAALEVGEVRRLEPVVVPALPIIVAGRVLRPDGSGVKGALVRLVPSAKISDLSDDNLHIMNLKVRTDADGSFMLRGHVEVEGWRAYARVGETGRSLLEPFRLGQDDLILDLAPAGSLAGKLLTSLPGSKPRVRLQSARASVKRGLNWVYPELDLDVGCRSDGGFKFEGLAPGSYTAVVWLAGYEVLVVTGIEIESDVVNRDPRLDGVSVGTELDWTSVTVRSPSGDPVAKARVRARVPTGESGPRVSTRTDKNGMARFAVPAGARRRVTVTKDGYIQWSKKDCSFPLSVTLDSGTHVVIDLDIAGGGLPVDERIRSWQVIMKPKSVKKSKQASLAAADIVRLKARSRVIGFRSDPRSPRQLTATLKESTREAVLKTVPAGHWEVSIRPRLHRVLKRGDQKIRVKAKPKTHHLGPATTVAGEQSSRIRFTVESSVLSNLIQE